MYWCEFTLVTVPKTDLRKLMFKLSNYGIDKYTLGWIQDGFLNNRQQCVVLEGEKSTYIHVTSGVPQGSVLGPILFLAFLNDLPNCVKSKVRLFADDTVIYLIVKSADDCIQLQKDLQSLEKWEKVWKMEFNIAKCKNYKAIQAHHFQLYPS